ncbi:MAG TPA: DUF454 family protein [Thermoanaerobaculia bacterium]|jgi:uncharacterized membrane protein YbaN (DUF454 family)|nr:DUF454 family protein [Thermoanaerobaculia bacterium]HPA51175.1 DUF454 family protein [Thermoanaerobaculia bacterium]HQN07616.1 DUF454 family protein [Thermoanaerobaculia bacterium]HQP86478.1 DUF454 family protein [Thermoanaerobaculia bacterium]
MKRKLLLAGGMVALGLGLAGLLLPVLPTTPFLLLAAALFARSSPERYERLLGHERLGPHVRDWVERRGLRRSVKVRAILLLWAALLPSSLWLGHRHLSGFLLLAVGAAVSAYLLRLPTLEEPPADAALPKSGDAT